MADPTSNFIKFVFDNPQGNPVTLEFDKSSLKPGHADFKNNMNDINAYRRLYGDPRKLEPDVKLNKFEEFVARQWEETKKGPFPSIKADEVPGQTLIPDETRISTAEDYRRGTSMAGQAAGAIALPGLGALGGLGDLALLSLGGLGAAGGELGAQQMQKEAGMTTEGPPGAFTAGVTDMAFGAGFSGITAGARGFVKRLLTGSTPRQEMRAVKEQLQRAGMQNPSLPQLSGNVSGIQPRMQQMSVDLPWSWKANKWLKSEMEAVTKQFKSEYQNIVRQEAGEIGQYAASQGRGVWRDVGGKLYDDAWTKFPQGQNTLVEIDPIINALTDSGTLNSEVLDSLSAGAPNAGKILKSFVAEYGTVLPPPATSPLIRGAPASLVRFRKAPIHEVERARKAVGQLFRANNDPTRPLTVAQKERNQVYGGFKDAIGNEARKLDAVNPNLGAEKSVNTANDFWKVNQKADDDYLKAFLKKADPVEFFNTFDTAAKSGKSKTLDTVMKRIADDPELGERAVMELQDGLISKYGLDDAGQFDRLKLAQWWVGLDQSVKDTVFGKGIQSSLDDFAKLGEVFFPGSRNQGSMFVQQQVERPGSLLSQALPAGQGNLMGGLTVGATGATAATGNIPLAAVVGSIFLTAPSIASRVMVNPALSKWVVNSAKIGPRSYADHIGKLVGIIRNTKDKDERELASIMLEELMQTGSNDAPPPAQPPVGSGLAGLPPVLPQ